MADDWDCEAYMQAPAVIRAMCFTAGQGKGACGNADECHQRMTAERQRVFTEIQELAATGDLTGVFLARQFTAPEQLLNGTLPPDVIEELPALIAGMVRQMVRYGVPAHVAAMALQTAFREGKEGAMELENKQCSNTKPHDGHWWDSGTKWCGGVENDDGIIPTS